VSNLDTVDRSRRRESRIAFLRKAEEAINRWDRLLGQSCLQKILVGLTRTSAHATGMSERPRTFSSQKKSSASSSSLPKLPKIFFRQTSEREETHLILKEWGSSVSSEASETRALLDTSSETC
jgi:hypothetical protein